MVPSEEYRSRLRDRQQRLQKLERWDNRIATLRGLAFLGLAWLTFVVLKWQSFPESVLSAPAALLLLLVVAHGRIRVHIDRMHRAIGHYQTGLERLKDRWAEFGSDGSRYRDAAHPYANDLDLFGPSSLFQLLNRCQTRLGEDCLAQWLKQPADESEIAARQQAVSELAPALDLRETLDVLHPPLEETRDQNHLQRWCDTADEPVPTTLLGLTTLAAVAVAVSLYARFAFEIPWSFFLVALAVQIVIVASRKPLIKGETQAVERALEGIDELVSVLRLIERQSHRAPFLKTLQQRLVVDGRTPAEQLARLRNLGNLLSNSIRNQFLAPLALAFGMHLPLIRRLQRWRASIGAHVANWLKSVAEWEAVLSLAAHRFEFPGNCLPTVELDGPRFVGNRLRHPLLPREQCVPNDVRIDLDHKLLLISGSNMSGKSTLLRTVGANVVLALSGASVHADALSLSVVQLGAAMRVNDSLIDGKSLFYAVVTRLKEIVDLSEGDRPLLYLIDEILPGTNSHDRRMGAEAVLRNLVARNTLGLVTTHDLALTRIADTLSGHAINLHFEDHLEQGRMHFDYRLREGVVTKSNALELMKMIGLEIDVASKAH